MFLADMTKKIIIIIINVYFQNHILFYLVGHMGYFLRGLADAMASLFYQEKTASVPLRRHRLPCQIVSP